MARPARVEMLLLLTGLVVACNGCALGPKAIEKTHGRYNAVVQQTDEEQFLKNVVRLRYVEGPRNLDVASIAAQYELTASAEMRPFFSTESVTGPVFESFSTLLPFASLSGASRPTISMIPQDDATSVRQFLTPISSDTLTFLGQAGWPVESIFRIWVDRLNGVPNIVPTLGPPREGAADFERFLRATELLQTSQNRELISVQAIDHVIEMSDPLPAEVVTAAAAVEAAKAGFEYRRREDGRTWALVKKEKRLVLTVNPAGRGSPELAELTVLLNLKPGLDRYELLAAAGVPDPGKYPSEPTDVLRVEPRSTAQALFFLANGVSVPTDHIACGLVRLPPDGIAPTVATQGLFRVHSCSSCKRPAQAYVAIRYRNHWFYIDDRDQESKATLLLMLELRRLDFQRQQIGAPALTLPVGR